MMMMEEDEEKEPEKHCCCAQKKAIMIYAGFLWILGILLFVNVCLIFGNMYFPLYYPLVSLFLALIYLVALVFISIWMCSDTETNRKLLLWGAWLIFVSVVSLLIWNIFFILNYNKKKKEGIHVGTGDDPDDYDEESRGAYILGYCIWGGIILILDILIICVIYAYLKTFEEPEEEKKEDMMMKDEKKDMMNDDAAGMEGGSVERRSQMSRSSSARKSHQSIRSQGMKSQASMKSQVRAPAKAKAPIANAAPPAAAPAPTAAQDQASKEEALRNLHAAAIREIDADDTPRNSMKDKLQYEDGEHSTSVQFIEDPQAQPQSQPQAESPLPQIEPEPTISRQVTKKNKKK